MNPYSTIYRAYAIYGAISMQLVAAVIVGAWLGKWLDDFLGTTPLFMIIGVLTGMIAGFYGVFVTIRYYEQKKAQTTVQHPQTTKSPRKGNYI